MNNNLSHLSQNLCESGTYFNNPCRNLNILSLLNSSNKQMLLENLNAFCCLLCLVDQNRQLLLNNGQNENHIYYNHISNNIINPSLNNILLNFFYVLKLFNKYFYLIIVYIIYFIMN